MLSVAQSTRHVDRGVAEESLQRRVVRFDAGGDDHYDVASAFIKSIRGLTLMPPFTGSPECLNPVKILDSSPDAWSLPHRKTLGTPTLCAGCRHSGLPGHETIGMPECRINLAQATTYLASAAKSNASYVAVDAALADIRSQSVIPVPIAFARWPLCGGGATGAWSRLQVSA